MYERMKEFFFFFGGQNCIDIRMSVCWQSYAQVVWKVNTGVLHSVFMLTGTISNYERYCETLGKAERSAAGSLFVTWSSLSFNRTMLDRKQIRKQLQGFGVLVLLSWITQHIASIWFCRVFISFPYRRTVLEDVTKLRTIQSEQQLRCGFVDKMDNAIVMNFMK